MKTQILLDTGPLVALLDRRDHYYIWATQTVAKLPVPFLTCESVISEACFLVNRIANGKNAIGGLIQAGHIKIPFNLEEEIDRIVELLERYQSVPMSLADACLVRMSERFPGSSILTLDSDFMIYRRNINQVIPVIMPQS
jgi:uncharacterized protein